jgi:hypothetical protein
LLRDRSSRSCFRKRYGGSSALLSLTQFETLRVVLTGRDAAVCSGIVVIDQLADGEEVGVWRNAAAGRGGAEPFDLEALVNQEPPLKQGKKLGGWLWSRSRLDLRVRGELRSWSPPIREGHMLMGGRRAARRSQWRTKFALKRQPAKAREGRLQSMKITTFAEVWPTTT